MDILLNLSAVSSEYDLRGLRRLYSEVKTNVRSLKAFGVEQDSYGAMQTPVMLTKLPPEIRLMVTRKTSGRDLDLAKLQEVLEEELIASEHSWESNQTHCQPHDQFQLPCTATAIFSDTEECTWKPSHCCFCQQSHMVSECHNGKYFDAHRQILKTSGRCFNCLEKGHIVKKCRSSTHCLICKRKHHPSICNQRHNETEPS